MTHWAQWPRTQGDRQPCFQRPVSSCPLIWPRIWLGEVGGGSRFCSYLFSPSLILDEFHCLWLWCPFSWGAPRPESGIVGSRISGTIPWRATVPSFRGTAQNPRRPGLSQALTILKLPPFGCTNHWVSFLGNQPADQALKVPLLGAFNKEWNFPGKP